MPKILKTQFKSKKEHKPAVIYLFCALRGVVVTFLVFMVVSLLLLNNSSFTTFTKVILYLGIALGSVVCGYRANKKLKGKGIVNGSVSSIFYCVLFFVLICLLLKFGISKILFFTIPLIVLSCITGGIICANK